jgi:hypothetical protein
VPWFRSCLVAGTFDVQNRGGQSASPSQVRFFLSADARLDPSDTLIQQTPVGVLAAGARRRIGVLSFRRPGTALVQRFVIALVDADQAVAERDETNNSVVFGPLS